MFLGAPTIGFIAKGGTGGGGGGTVTGANNGLSLSGTIVQLGGNPLIQDTQIPLAGYNLRFQDATGDYLNIGEQFLYYYNFTLDQNMLQLSAVDGQWQIQGSNTIIAAGISSDIIYNADSHTFTSNTFSSIGATNDTRFIQDDANQRLTYQKSSDIYLILDIASNSYRYGNISAGSYINYQTVGFPQYQVYFNNFAYIAASTSSDEEAFVITLGDANATTTNKTRFELENQGGNAYLDVENNFYLTRPSTGIIWIDADLSASAIQIGATNGGNSTKISIDDADETITLSGNGLSLTLYTTSSDPAFDLVLNSQAILHAEHFSGNYIGSFGSDIDNTYFGFDSITQSLTIAGPTGIYLQGPINGAYTLPTVDGTNNQVITTDGAGTAFWGTPIGTGTISGADMEIAYFNGAATVVSDGNFLWDYNNLTLTVYGAGGRTLVVDPTNGLYQLGDIQHGGNGLFFQIDDTNNSATIKNLTGNHTFFEIDPVAGVYEMGDMSGTINFSFFQIDDGNRVAQIFFGGNPYFGLDQANNLYYIGDINSINNGTAFAIDDLTGAFTMASNAHNYFLASVGTQTFQFGDINNNAGGNYLWINNSANFFTYSNFVGSYIYCDAGNFLFEFGDISGAGQHTYLAIDDANAGVNIFGFGGVSNFMLNFANQWSQLGNGARGAVCFIDGTGEKAILGDYNSIYSGTQVIVDGPGKVINLAINAGAGGDLRIDGVPGVSGTWTTVDGKTITATNGIITSIV